MAPDRAYLIVRSGHRTPRRHRVGRHRAGPPGQRRARAALTAVRSVDRARPGRHAARRLPPSARYAPLAVALSTLLVSGWFAVSGAATFATIVRP